MNEVRIERRQRRVIEAQPGEATDSGVLDQDVGISEEAPKDGLSVLGLQIEPETPLVPVDREEVGRRPRSVRVRTDPRRAPAPGRVALRRFDLDDVSAKVGEQHRAVRSREHGGTVDHAQALEWAGCRRAFGGVRPVGRLAAWRVVSHSTSSACSSRSNRRAGSWTRSILLSM